MPKSRLDLNKDSFPIPDGRLPSSCYCRFEKMKVHAFRASVDFNLQALTTDHSGSNLPPLVNHGRWIYWKEFDLLAGQPHIAVDPDKALAEIAASGFYLAGTKVSVTTNILRP